MERRTWWGILVLGLAALGAIPLLFTRPSWKLGLAVLVASLLAMCWVLLLLSIRDPRRWAPKVAVMIGVAGGLVLGELGAGVSCTATDCAAGFDALVLLPLGALIGAIVGGSIGYAVASHVKGRPRATTPSTRPVDPSPEGQALNRSWAGSSRRGDSNP